MDDGKIPHPRQPPSVDGSNEAEKTLGKNMARTREDQIDKLVSKMVLTTGMGIDYGKRKPKATGSANAASFPPKKGKETFKPTRPCKICNVGAIHFHSDCPIVAAGRAAQSSKPAKATLAVAISQDNTIALEETVDEYDDGNFSATGTLAIGTIHAAASQNTDKML